MAPRSDTACPQCGHRASRRGSRDPAAAAKHGHPRARRGRGRADHVPLDPETAEPVALREHLATVERELESRGADGARKAKRSGFHELFRRIAHATAGAIGTPIAFMVALAVIIVWAALGPVFGYSDTWQLVINTGTTIVTFLVVFMIQNTQNRDSQAIHLKLDELIRAVGTARNAMVDVEDLPDEELTRLQREMHQLCAEAGTATARGCAERDDAPHQ